MRSRFTLHHFFLVLILGGYFLFGLQHLSRFITADEHYWIYERIPQYWDALATGKWSGTLINDKPGITLALVSGAGLLVTPHPETLCTEDAEYITTCRTGEVANTLLAFRLPLLLVNGLVLWYLFWILKKLSGEKTALLTVLFTALSPILLGITQIINPDALLWSMSAAALFTFFALLQFRHRYLLFLSGCFLALALLSKYTASFLIFFFFTLAILRPFFTAAPLSRTTFASLIRENLRLFFGTLACSFIIGFLLFPAAWLKPTLLTALFLGGDEIHFPLFLAIPPLLLLLDVLFFNSRLLYNIKTFSDRTNLLAYLQKFLPWLLLLLAAVLVLGRMLYPEWILFEKIPFDLKDLYSSDKPDPGYTPTLLQSWLLEWNPLLFSLPPLTLLFLFFALGKNSGRSFIDFSLVLFLFSFTGALLLSEVLATARYLIILYPILAYLAARGVMTFLTVLSSLSFFLPYQKWLSPAVILGLFLSAFGSLLFIQPFYFNYTNALLPKTKVIHHAWGYGGYEAAQYLNRLPGAENLTIWADYYGVCEFFVGRCIEFEYQAAALAPIDYVVVSARGKTLYEPSHTRWLKPKNFSAALAYATETPLWELLIDGRPSNFIRVVKHVPKNSSVLP